MKNSSQRGKHGNRLALVIVILAVIGAGLFGVRFWEERQDKAAAGDQEPALNDRPRVYYNDSWYELRDDLETFLGMGLDQYESAINQTDGYNNHQQADFLLLMIADKKSNTYTALHINRDTMAEIQRLGLNGQKLDTFTGQLALAHTYGSGGKDSCRNTVTAVSRFLYDVPIDHYFSVTMDAIPVLNDLVGGVTVHIDDDFSAVDPSLKQGKDVRLVGQQALTFVRSRGGIGDSSNLSRMERQRAFVSALYTQLSRKMQENEGFGRQLALKLADYTVSDLTTTELSNFAERYKDYTFVGIQSMQGEAVKGEQFMEYYVDEADLQRLVIELFFEPDKG